MAKPLPNDLNYGHVGQATYSLENSEWKFAREPGHGVHLQQLGLWKTVFDSPTNSDHASNSVSEPGNVREAQQAAKFLGRSEPTLLPSLALLPEKALASASIASATRKYDPALGDLLSFGSFTSQGLYTNARPIVAHPAGNNGNVLCLGMLTRERNGWGRDRSVWIQGPSMTDVEKGYWVEDAVPIQQICFAQGDNRASFLAVRLHMRTRIFRPVYHDRRKPVVRSPFYDLPPSRIDPRPILSISLDQTGGIPHADVTFNPDYQRQLGVVDQKGNWSIWDIDGGSKRASKYTISCTLLGPLIGSEVGTEDGRPKVQEDGWARILWIGDVNTIIVCKRREIKVFDISENKYTVLKSPELMLEHSADWILDVKKHPLYAHRFFVLTSTRLFLVAVTCKKEIMGNRNMEPGARVLLLWTHFRGLEDITLQLCAPSLTPEESVVYIFSHLNTLVTVYNFRNESSDASRPVSCSDPVMLSYNRLVDQLNTPQYVAHIHMDWLHFRGDEHLSSSGPGPSYMEHGVQFYRLSVMLSDLSIRQAIFYTRPPSMETIPKYQLSIEPPAWATIVHARGTVLLSEDLVGLGDDFIIPDGIDTTSVPTLKSRMWQLILPSMPRRRPYLNGRDWEPASTGNYSDIYDALTRAAYQCIMGEDTLVETEEVSTIIAWLQNQFVSGSNLQEPLRGTLLEASSTTPRVADIDEASTQMQDLFRKNGGSHSFGVQQISLLHPLPSGASNDQEVDMSFLYDSILQHWIAPLPTTIPSRMRQVKERLARRIAAEVVFASFSIRQPLVANAEPSSSRDRPTAGFGQDRSIPMSSQGSVGLPGLTHIAESFSSQTDSPEQIHPTQSNAITRLSQHLQITKPPITISPNISQVLMHWQLAADPKAYDWETTTHSINVEFNTDESNERERERSKRKAERLLKKKMRELELEKRNIDSEPGFGRTVGGLRSSPAPIVGLGMSSQTQAEYSQRESQSQGIRAPHIVQSQIEPGRHGGKPQVKKRKGKARVSGF